MSFEFPRILSFHVHSFSILTCTCLYLKSFAFYVIKIFCSRTYVITTVNIYITRIISSLINSIFDQISFPIFEFSCTFLHFISSSFSDLQELWKNAKYKNKKIEKNILLFYLSSFFSLSFSIGKKETRSRCQFYLLSWRPHFIFSIFTGPTVREDDSFFSFFFHFPPVFFFSFTMLSFLYRSWIELVFEDSFRYVLNSTDHKELSNLWSNL